MDRGTGDLSFAYSSLGRRLVPEAETLLPGGRVGRRPEPSTAPPADDRSCIAVIRVGVGPRVVPVGIPGPADGSLLQLRAGFRRGVLLRAGLRGGGCLLLQRLCGGGLRWRWDRSSGDGGIVRLGFHRGSWGRRHRRDGNHLRYRKLLRRSWSLAEDRAHGAPLLRKPWSTQEAHPDQDRERSRAAHSSSPRIAPLHAESIGCFRRHRQCAAVCLRHPVRGQCGTTDGIRIASDNRMLSEPNARCPEGKLRARR